MGRVLSFRLSVTPLMTAAVLLVVGVYSVVAPTSAFAQTRLQQRAANVLDAGHRGLWAGNSYDENTVAACKYALHRGADACELDTQETKDHVPMVLHDSTLNRTTNCSGSLKNRNRSAVYHCRTTPAHAHVPSLATFVTDVKAAYPNAKLIIEIKPHYPSPTYLQRLVDWANTMGTTQVTFESFYPKNLKAIGLLAPDIPRLLISGSTTNPPTAAKVATYNVSGLILPYSGMQYKLRHNSTYVSDFTAAGLQIMPWDVNSLTQMKTAVGDGVTGIITNYAGKFADWRKG